MPLTFPRKLALWILTKLNFIPLLFLFLVMGAPAFGALTLSDAPCIVDAAKLGLPNPKELIAKAREAAGHLGYPGAKIIPITMGGDKGIFRLETSDGKKIGIGISLGEKSKEKVEWEARVSSGFGGRGKGLKEIKQVKDMEGVISWEWSETTLDKELDNFYRLSQSDPEMFLDLMQQLAEALDSMHSPFGGHPAILHRDIKLANIHVSVLPNGDLELSFSDVGISAIGTKQKDGKYHWQLADKLTPESGTVMYLNKSRVDGKISEQDDIPAFGISMAELLVGAKVNELRPGEFYNSRLPIADPTGKIDVRKIPRFRKPISEISSKVPKELGLIADYTMDLAKSMREVRELMGEVTKMRAAMSGPEGSIPVDKEKLAAEFQSYFFKNYLVPKLKSWDKEKRDAAILFVFRSPALVDELIASPDVSIWWKGRIVKFVDSSIKKGTLDNNKLTNYFGDTNPYYSSDGFKKAREKIPTWWVPLPFR